MSVIQAPVGDQSLTFVVIAPFTFLVCWGELASLSPMPLVEMLIKASIRTSSLLFRYSEDKMGVAVWIVLVTLQVVGERVDVVDLASLPN